MPDKDKLPFNIYAKIFDRRGGIMLMATINDEQVAMEKHTPGDGKSRKLIAEKWAVHPRIAGAIPNPKGRKKAVTGNKLTELIAVEIERVEIAAMPELEKIREQGDDAGPVVELPNYVDDDLIAELAWNTSTDAPDFIICDRNQKIAGRGESVTVAGGRRLIVPSSASGIVTPGGGIRGTIFLPTEHEPFGENESRLRRDVRQFVDRYVELPDDAAAIAVEYILLTWVHDRFDELPYLAFRTSDAGRGKSRALETVGTLCYRPMFAGGGSSAAATLRLLDVFGGTLVADEFDQNSNTELAADLTRIINQGFQRNRPLVKCDGENNAPRPFNCFGPKLFALRKGFSDDAAETRVISITMRQRTRKDIPLSLPRERFDAEALALRNRLLAWRFANYGRIAIDPRLADVHLEDRFNQIGLTLLAISPTAETRKIIVDALTTQQGAVAADRSDTFAGEVFEIVLARLNAGVVEIRPGEVANEINRRKASVEGVGIDKLKDKMTAHFAGKILCKDLELRRLPKDSEGARYAIDKSRVEQLASRFGVPPGETSPRSPTSPAPESSPENRVFDSASGVSDVSDDSDVPGEGGEPNDCDDGFLGARGPNRTAWATDS